MTKDTASFPPEYFERLYEANKDPWNFTTSDYERQKYAATLDILSQHRFHAALEIGCSIGILTRRLAPLCNTLIAVDVAEAALTQARQNCAGLDQVSFQRMEIPKDWPMQSFDLILLSEVLYFLGQSDIRRTASRVVTSLLPGATVLLVHYTKGTDYPCGGDEAVEIFIDAVAPSIKPARQYREPAYRLDLMIQSH